MATKIGPKTVDQQGNSKNLVFCIDAAHSDSYGGEPTTNVFPDPEPAGNFSASNTSDSAGTISYGSEDGIPHLIISNTTVPQDNGGSGTDYPRINFNNLTSTVTDGFSISFEAKADDEGKVLNFALYSSGLTKTTQTANLTTEWKKFTFNNITTGFTLDDGYLRPNETYSGNKYIRRIQIEQKTSSTPFTATSRTASNAVKNISGVGALGTTLTGTFAAYGQELFKPTNRKVLASFNINQGHIGGAYWDFDGTDEFIVTPVGFQVGNTRQKTIAMWVDVDSGVTLTMMGDNGNNYKWQWMKLNSHQPMNNASSYGTRYFYADTITSAGWTLVVDVADQDQGTGNRVRRYIDGVLVAVAYTDTDSGDSMYDGTDMYLQIGSANLGSGASQFLNGRVANCMIWSAALTAKEVKDIYIAQKGRFGK
mgnify:CR=1 FL=1